MMLIVQNIMIYARVKLLSLDSLMLAFIMLKDSCKVKLGVIIRFKLWDKPLKKFKRSIIMQAINIIKKCKRKK